MKIAQRPAAGRAGASPTTIASDAVNANHPLSAIARPALLVSVRDADEATAARHGGADVIDIKEPNNGPLGRASDAVVRDVVRTVDRRTPVTAALGELHELEEASIAPPPSGLAAIKCGLSRSHDFDWVATLGRLRSTAIGAPLVVPVVYADHAEAHAAPAATLVTQLLASPLGFRAVAIDTYDKRGAGAVELLGAEGVQALASACHQRGTAMILAGRVRPDRMTSGVVDAADVLAVRGAACVGGRTGRVDRRLVESLAQRLAHARLLRPSGGRNAS